MRDGEIIANDELIHLSHSLDSPFSQGAATAAVLEGELVSIDEEYSIAQVAIGENTHIHIALNSVAPIHKKLRLQIPAKDISISLSRAEQSSILNILPCTIVEVEFKSTASALLKLQLGEQFLLAMITRKSLDALQLKVGMPVFAQIKSIALLRGRTQ
jgi:molybdate transport system ATP-binding protein